MRADGIPDELLPGYRSSPAPIHRPEDFDIGIRQNQGNFEANADPFADSGHIYRGPNQTQFSRDTSYHGVGEEEEEEEEEASSFH